jgi:hypothetical protein
MSQCFDDFCRLKEKVFKCTGCQTPEEGHDVYCMLALALPKPERSNRFDKK